MKKLFSLLVLIHLCLFANGFATIKTITVQNYSFSPANTAAFVGDTIKFQWVNGSHTSTCNGNSGSILPAGATPWNVTMGNSSSTFMYILTTAGSYKFVCIPHSASMTGNLAVTMPTGINTITSAAPVNYSLSQNFPNPFNPETKINFNIVRAGAVKLSVYNLAGEEVSSLVNESLNAGSYSVSFNGLNLSSGVYFYRLQAEGYSEIKKMTLVK